VKVRDLLRLVEGDGWYLVHTRGSHRQYKHPSKPGLVTVRPGHPEQRSQASGAEAMKRYLVVVEQTGTGFSAYSPDLPGCIATGSSREDVEVNMREAIEFHIEGLRLEGCPVPEPTSESTYIDVAA
jgi:predicted RNase H-like HicB family nuclease/predicted RNA binding protein YcfA (HicA-like mRNA interferase family)